jgi:uncharacterized RDD family membrane protein YckC
MTQTKVATTTRVVAKLIDLFLVIAAAAILPYPLGPLMGFTYSVAGDGMRGGPFRGQSIGKKLLKLRVINTATKHPASLRDSVLRNAPVGVATFFAIIPIWGWLILGFIGLPLMMMEIYLMVSVESGHRLGDVMGDTEVIHAREKDRGSREPTL